MAYDDNLVTSRANFHLDRNVDEEQGLSEMFKYNVEKKVPFISNHQYETRTHQEWRSSTRSQWECGKVELQNYKTNEDKIFQLHIYWPWVPYILYCRHYKMT
ncbi:hypothetical protein DICVIV_14510 [Dictyocaulus viviparus]|uniref:Uncharacterized protein n=1 Tax=Dictyocaulus viviparus TaxID=29172 RepID=A0A0D8X732_DICVI|nr:hypothetical protein DICVIV_14510 [Dictyocaulus viviparus]